MVLLSSCSLAVRWGAHSGISSPSRTSAPSVGAWVQRSHGTRTSTPRSPLQPRSSPLHLRSRPCREADRPHGLARAPSFCLRIGDARRNRMRWSEGRRSGAAPSGSTARPATSHVSAQPRSFLGRDAPDQLDRVSARCRRAAPCPSYVLSHGGPAASEPGGGPVHVELSTVVRRGALWCTDPSRESQDPKAALPSTSTSASLRWATAGPDCPW